MPRQEAPSQRSVNLQQLSIQELDTLQQQLERDCQQLYEKQLVLEGVVQKYVQSSKAVKQLQETQAGSTALIPLTQSLYVKGEVEDPTKVLLDIGTSYVVQYTTEDAAEFCERKETFLKNQITNLAKMANDQKYALTAVQEMVALKKEQQKQQEEKEKSSSAVKV